MICTQWGMLSDTCPHLGMGEERRISAMYTVGTLGDTCPQWRMGGGEKDLCHVYSGGCSVRHVLSGAWGKRGGSLRCTHWYMGEDRRISIYKYAVGTLSQTCPLLEMGEERRICVMYTVVDAQ